jgi:D-3-phosphoglycerate dehydrogenase
MSDLVLEGLIRQLVEWLSEGEQPYDSVMNAWRTSCPRLPVWEDAHDRGLVSVDKANGQLIVRLTPAGLALLEQERIDAPASHPENRAPERCE